MGEHSTRRRLPDTRPSITHEVVITDMYGQEHTLFLIVGLFEDGTPGEVFIRIGKVGSTMSGLLDTIGKLTSYGLQHGVPLGDLCTRLRQVDFEPKGHTSNEKIPICTSVVDYTFALLAGME